MGLKKKSKVSAEFSMSSLTDIIFLLLIFFMLTSSLIIPNALNLKLPGKSNSNSISDSRPTIITIERDGTYFFNGNKVSLSGVEKKVIELKRNDRKAAIVITPDPKAPNRKVVAILDMVARHGLNGTLTDPR